MTEEKFEQHLQELLSKIETLPESQRAPLLEMVEETRSRHRVIREATTRALSALDDWRLILKYRIFDAEARQREAGSGPG